MPRHVFRTCHLCEAGCGLKIEVDGDQIVSVLPDDDDVFSQGYICPKGAAIGSLHHDPDRLRQPLRRTRHGDFEPISWDEALDTVAARFAHIRRQHGGRALAIYTGNPLTHNHGLLLLRNALFRALGTRNCTSAGSQDTSPRFCTSFYLYGSSLALPVPDLERTQYLLILGANPRASNGSFCTAPDFRGRLKKIRQRGGKIVVVDPRRTETARDADEHVAILPGGDAALLMAMLHVLHADGRLDRAAIARQTVGWDEIERRLPAFTPEAAARLAGVDADTIRRLAREFAAAPSAVAYSRVGVCNSRYGTAATFATDLLNIATGRLGAVGGWMFPRGAFGIGPLISLTGDGHDRWRSRVRGLPETFGELPATILAEEIETPGQGQVRALLTVAGNPVSSVPNGRRLAAALGQLEFMASLDIYVNETTRHAHIILPPAWSLVEPHVDVVLNTVAVREVARWSPAVVPQPADSLTDWQIVLQLLHRWGKGPTGMPWLDRLYGLARRLGYRWTPDSTLDLILRIGPHGDRFLPWSRGLNLRRLKQATHGLDFGPLEPGFEHRVTHRDRRVHLAAPPLLASLDEVTAALGTAALGSATIGTAALDTAAIDGRTLTPAAPASSADSAHSPADDTLLLIGRRDLRSNNSWMHNVPELVSGRPRCTLLIHPQDAARRGLQDGQPALLETPLHRGPVPIEITDAMRPGVVCLPHGWGQTVVSRHQRVAGAQPGVSFNDWVDDRDLETTVGQSILNGVPVRLSAATADAAHTATATAAITPA